MRKRFGIIAPWLAALGIGLSTIYVSFPPRGLGLLMLVGIIPGFIIIEKARSAREAFRLTWLSVWAATMTLCPWVAHCLHEFAGVPWPIAYPLVGVFALFAELTRPVVIWLRHHLHHTVGCRPVLWTPLAIMALDSAVPKLFPNTSGIVLYRVPWLIQAADLTGLWLLSAVIVATNELGAILWLRTWPRAEIRRHAIATVVFVGGVVIYGAIRHHQVREAMSHPSAKLRVAMIQPNINSSTKVKAEVDHSQARAEVFALMRDFTLKAVTETSPDLVVWPETSYPNFYHSDTPREEVALTAELDALVNRIQVPILFGARDERSLDQFNTIFLASPAPGGPEIQRYHKHLLLLVGEWIPLVRRFPKLTAWFYAHNTSFFTPGPGPVVLTIPKARLGPMICLEGLYSRFVRRLTGKGVDVLVNATNDSWYGQGGEQELHLTLTALRSIEMRRPLVRATNTGISAFVDIDGSLRLRTGRDTPAIAFDELPLYSGIGSPYLFFGDFWLWVAALYCAYPFARWGIGRYRGTAKRKRAETVVTTKA